MQFDSFNTFLTLTQQICAKFHLIHDTLTALHQKSICLSSCVIIYCTSPTCLLQFSIHFFSVSWHDLPTSGGMAEVNSMCICKYMNNNIYCVSVKCAYYSYQQVPII